MANDFFTPSGAPSTGSSLSSAVIRAVFTALQASFDKMPSLTGTGGRLVRVNPGSTALEAMTLTAGAVLYGGGNNEVVQGNNFVWNAANNTLAVVGTISSAGTIKAGGAVTASGTRNVDNANTSFLEFTAAAGRILVEGTGGSRPANGFQILLASDVGGSALTVFNTDQNGNTTLNNLNATQVGVTNLNVVTQVVTPKVTTASGDLTLTPAAGNGNVVINPTGGGKVNVGGTLNATTSLTAPILDSVVGTLLLKGAGTTAATITNANIQFAGTIDAVGNATLNNLNISGALRGTSSMLSPLNNSLAADLNLNNSSVFFDGPSVAQGNNGTWFVSGKVSLTDTAAGARSFFVKLWDGNTVLDSTEVDMPATALFVSASLSGFISSPNGNLRISVKDPTAATGKILFNQSGAGKDSTITAVRIG